MYFQLCSASLQHRKAAGKEGTGTNGSSRSQGPESSRGDQPLHRTGRAKTVTVSHWSNVLPVCVTDSWPLSPKGVFKIITEHLSCREQPGGCAHPILLGFPSSWHKGIYPPGASLVPEDACVRALPVGTGAECVVMGTFSCCD